MRESPCETCKAEKMDECEKATYNECKEYEDYLLKCREDYKANKL